MAAAVEVSAPGAERRASVLSVGEWAAGGVALVLSIVHLVVWPNSGTDLAAQLARASFARTAPLNPVDFSWYSGVHPFGYSLVSPWIMAVLGVSVSGVVAAVGAAVLFARLVRDSRWPVAAAVCGAFFAVADVASGRTTFALSLVALLAAILLRERRGWAIAFATLTALMSPVGAVFLGLVAAVLVLHRRPGGWSLGIPAAVVTVALTVVFPGGGVQPFSFRSALPALAAAAVVALLADIATVRTGAALYALAIVAALLFQHDAFGSNVLRLGLIAAAPVLLATHRSKPALTVALAVGVACWQVSPLVADLRAPTSPTTQALVAELRHVGAKRVEVVAPRDHLESSTVAAAIPLARGWSRQIDYRDNPLFYEGDLTEAAYRAWLDAHAVDHVAVPRGTPIDFGSRREAVLLSSHHVAGLREIWHDRGWTLFAVRSPRSIVDAPARVVSSTRTALTVRSPRVADVTVRLRWSLWLSATGPGCIARRGDQVSLRFSQPGTVVIGSSLLPRGRC